MGTAALLVLLVALFDWNWFRPALEHYLSQASGRSVRATDLHLSLDADGQPVVRLRGVHVDNAPWADTSKPFITARELRFTFDRASLFQEFRLITRLVMIDAEVNTERRADGLRNWRLTRPDYRGPGRVRLLALEPHNSSLNMVSENVGLVLQTRSTPLAQPDGQLTQRVQFSGTFRGAPFSGDVLAGPELTLLQTGRFFALRGRAQTAQTVLQLDGVMADLARLGGLDAQMHLSGPSLAQLKSFFPDPPWPDTQPYRAQAHLTRHAESFDARRLHITLGRSDVSGQVSYRAQQERTTVRATLRSERLDSADLPALGRIGKADEKKRVLPRNALPLEQLDNMDASFDWRAQALHIRPLRPLQDVHVHAELDHHRLSVALREAALAAGRLSGEFTLDTRLRTPEVRIQAQARALNLAQLWPALPEKAGLDAPLDLQLDLRGRGRSLGTWAASAEGQASATLGSGHISKRLASQLSLHLGTMAGALFDRDGTVALHCAHAALDLKDGVARSRRISLDTARTHVEGQGQLRFDDETWSLQLTPQKKRRYELLRLDSTIQLDGSFGHVKHELVDRVPIEPPAEGEGACGVPRRAPG